MGLKGMEEALAAVFPHTTLQTLHCPSAASEPRLREWEAAQTAGGGLAHDLRGPACRPCSRRARCVRTWSVGAAVSDDRGRLAPGLVGGRSVLRVSAGDSARHLHHECARERARATPQGHQETRAFSQRRRGDHAVWLALRRITAKWERAAPTWRQAMNQFAILYGDRFI